jgi:REP element-mobilizing transposase RayT
MTYDPEVHHRRSIRLAGYDYRRAGAYFVTICAQGRECLFGCADNPAVLAKAGHFVEAVWQGLPDHYSHVELDAFVVMPNHIHGIVVLVDGEWPGLCAGDPAGAGFEPAPTRRHGLPEVVRAFKTFSARRINEARGTPGVPVWQRNYYEHIIRNEEALNRIREYIVENPARWAEDPENPYATPRAVARGERSGAGIPGPAKSGHKLPDLAVPRPGYRPQT